MLGGVAIAVLNGGSNGPELDTSPSYVAECARPGLGVHSTLAFDADTEHRAVTVEAIHSVLGAQVVRDSLLWHQVEPMQGDRDWSRLDSVIAELQAAGIEPLLVVVGSPPWVNGVSETERDHYLYVPRTGPRLDAWLERYRDFLAEAVGRYSGAVRRWEIWNEPNHAAFWRPRPEPQAYRRVYEALRATILRVDPTADVAVGGLGRLTIAPEPDIPGLAFLRRLTQGSTPIDNVAIHPYPTDDHAPGLHVPGENNFDDIERTRKLLLAAGERVPIWVTEWGWSSATVGARRQARYVDESLEILETQYPFVRLATYFVDRDRPPEFFHGLLDEDLQPKPAASVFEAHTDRVELPCE